MMNMTWYETLNKPELTPPPRIFTQVWIVLYIMMAISLFLLLKAETNSNKKVAFMLFILQLILNFGWIRAFFQMQNIRLAMIIVFLMGIFVFATITAFYKHSKLAAILLIPYFLQVIFAIYLNFNFLILNT